jgi:hypothetical protein
MAAIAFQPSRVGTSAYYVSREMNHSTRRTLLCAQTHDLFRLENIIFHSGIGQNDCNKFRFEIPGLEHMSGERRCSDGHRVYSIFHFSHIWSAIACWYSWRVRQNVNLHPSSV